MGDSTKQFRVSENDLAILERCLPILHECASLSPIYARADVTVAVEECKRIMSDIRWDYAPYQQANRI